jgi:hypothetical protein
MDGGEGQGPASPRLMGPLLREISAREQSVTDIKHGREGGPEENYPRKAEHHAEEAGHDDHQHDRQGAGLDGARVEPQQVDVEFRIGDALFGQTVARPAHSVPHVAVAIGFSPVNNDLVGKVRRRFVHGFSNLRVTHPSGTSRSGE